MLAGEPAGQLNLSLYGASYESVALKTADDTHQMAKLSLPLQNRHFLNRIHPVRQARS